MYGVHGGDISSCSQNKDWLNDAMHEARCYDPFPQPTKAKVEEFIPQFALQQLASTALRSRGDGSEGVCELGGSPPDCVTLSMAKR